MEKISGLTLDLIEEGLSQNIYQGYNLQHAIILIADNDMDRLIRIYKYSRHNGTSNPNSRIASKDIGMISLKIILKNTDAFIELLSNLPQIYDISVEEFELIVNYVFEKLPEHKVDLIKFVSQFGGKSKIHGSNIPIGTKRELESYLVINELEKH